MACHSNLGYPFIFNLFFDDHGSDRPVPERSSIFEIPVVTSLLSDVMPPDAMAKIKLSEDIDRSSFGMR
jgi:hypothetical protein